MYVRTMNELIDDRKEPVVLVFSSTEEAKWLIKCLQGYTDEWEKDDATKDYDEKSARVWASFPDGTALPEREAEHMKYEVDRRMKAGFDEVTALKNPKPTDHEGR